MSAPVPTSNGASHPVEHAPEALDEGIAGYTSVEALLEDNLPQDKLEAVRRLLYGVNQGQLVSALALPPHLQEAVEYGGFDVQGYAFTARREQLREPRVVRLGLIQHGIQVSTSKPYAVQREAIFTRVEELVRMAGQAGVNVLCLQEAWPMPFAFCTREREWCEFAEDAVTGPSTALLSSLAVQYRMVIISPILERDSAHADVIWNTAVVIGHNGNVIGKHRKNHIPRIPPFDESHYYMEGDTGHPVFQTVYGRVAVNICYGRHHPLNWLAFGLNGAEVVFNPSATIGALSEPMWGVEARNAAIANSYFVAAINRVGTELYPHAFTTGVQGQGPRQDMGPFYGSSYVAAPDASRTPGLSRDREGLLVVDADLNLCQQVRDRWGFQMTARYPLYAQLLGDFIKPGYKPQVVVDPTLDSSASRKAADCEKGR
ncbi:hypothetical protein ACKKBF_B38855 [Auxenochlorella protothecoides x Auxenochlorella symbiontica]